MPLVKARVTMDITLYATEDELQTDAGTRQIAQRAIQAVSPVHLPKSIELSKDGLFVMASYAQTGHDRLAGAPVEHESCDTDGLMD